MTTPDTDPIGELAQLAGDFLDNQCSAITTALPDDPSTVLRPMIEIVLEEAAAQQWVEKQIAETGLKSMDFRNGMSMDLEPARDMVAQWVGAARAMLGDAPNYTETPVEMVVKVGESPERYAFTLQRVGKITPHQARQKAEADLDTMLRIITEYVVESNDIGGLDANDLVSRLGSAGFPLPDEDGEATP
ncbi:hypothetical protein OG875_05115 [Streptomyces sp. NBC_01498]|uniref:hypothetical protein n=1 Tax=Streptomyces sp. NBC_01498 TaxID=2975870 RepID=UPI002E7B6D02|nr:hypothetical protein [Streptomyces sp. NBC_01498]WTL24038.1 hypothetical protein OG875_05115 [Streptomyces sp. NBC_01498]